MTLGSLPPGELRRRLCSGQLLLRTGPFVYRLQSPHALVAHGVAQMYADMPLADSAGSGLASPFADFSVVLAHGAGLRRWVRPQARFLFDGQAVFEPLPADHAYPLLEWTMNWCVSAHVHTMLVVHAAVLERNGGALILPAPPGSGKSTLCAALLHSGWRLLSDELTLVSLADGLVQPLCRPVSLKNQSIDLMRAFAPAAEFTRVTHETTKGSVTHMRVPAAHLAAVHQPARPRWVVYPRWEAGAAAVLGARPRASAAVDLARNAFNFGVLGAQGFHAVTRLVDACDCFDFRYSRLDDALRVFDRLASTAPAAPGAGLQAA